MHVHCAVVIHVYYHLFVFTDSATVADLVGLTFWKYLETAKDPVALVRTAALMAASTIILRMKHINTGFRLGGEGDICPPPPLKIVLSPKSNNYYVSVVN